MMDNPEHNHFEALARELERRFAAGAGDPWPDGEFDALALRAFVHQLESNPTYRAFCEGRGVTPTAVHGWRDVPAVPATAFKHLDLVSTEATATASGATFRTSGTTAGPALRGRHVVPRLSLYRASLIPPFKEHLLPDVGEIRFVSLVPSPRELPDSSLSYMVGAAAEAFATEVHWVVSGAGVIDEARVRAVLARLSKMGEPCLLLGTALALSHLLDRLGTSRVPPLPEGSRVMETGGFKGSTGALSPEALHARLRARLGVPPDRVVSEYGMTELLSQLYTPVLREGAGAAGEHVPPPWLRVRALDPVTLEELAPGAEGLLAFFDLANLGSVCHVLTEDVGSVTGGRVRLSGRSSGAEPRGCSRAMDELMAAAGPAL
jgi:hypothetical protein